MVAPVRFALVKDGVLAWTSRWLQASKPAGATATSGTPAPGAEAGGSVEPRVAFACEPITGVSSLVLVVESEWSGGARCVWVDPHVIAAPLADVALSADLLGQAASADVSLGCMHGARRMSFAPGVCL